MDIGLLTLIDRAHPDGIGRYTRILIRELVAAGTDHHFHLFHQRDDPGVPDGPQVTNVRIKRPLPGPLASLVRNLRFLGTPLDLLHGPYNGVPFGGFRRVITIHDLLPLVRPWPVAAHRFQFRVITPMMARTCDRIMADSAWTKDEIVRQYAVPPEKVRVVYPAAEVLRLPEEEVRRRCAALRVPDRYVLAVGNMSNPVKNAHGLIAAYADSGLAAAGVGLVLAGREPAYLDRDALIVRPGLRHHVRLTGEVSEEDLAALYQGALALAQPSFGEGFGYPVVEAFLHGLPVVASTAPAVGEIAGNAALLVDPDDRPGLAEALRKVTEDGTLRADLIARGRARSALFAPKQMARQVLEVYAAAAAR